MNKLLTAAHNVLENGKLCQGQFSICLKVEKDFPNSDEHVVSVVEYNSDNDWAVLSVDFKFETFDTFEIAPLDSIRPIKYGDKYKMLHCPCELYNNESKASLLYNSHGYCTSYNPTHRDCF